VEQQLQQCKENVRLVDIGVLEGYYSSEWLSPSFAIPKKIVTIRVVTELRKLNLLLKLRISPISYSKIRQMIRSMELFSFASALDLNMGYYHIKLDHDAEDQKLCTISSPWHLESKNKTLTRGYQDCP
jgi:hypothetical protein